MYFELVGEITEVETIATGRGIRDLARLRRRYGASRWRDQAIHRLMAATRTKKRYLLCVRNKGCEDLEPRKLYEQLPDSGAAEDGYVRVVDESGEDYLYPG